MFFINKLSFIVKLVLFYIYFIDIILEYNSKGDG